MTNLSVYVEGRDVLIEQMFLQEGWAIADNLFEASLLCLEGGDDVTPEIYGEKNVASYNNPEKDYHSFGLISLAYDLDIPVCAICRGSQVMCVFNGGKMRQHIEGHGRDHTLEVDGVVYDVSSTHHQESVPNEAIPESNIYRAPDGVVELVYYENERMFGMQSHPEYFGKGHDNRNLFFKFVNKIM